METPGAYNVWKVNEDSAVNVSHSYPLSGTGPGVTEQEAFQ